MIKKVIIFSISFMFVLLSFNLQAQEPNKVIKTGNADIYVGTFDLKTMSVDCLHPASEVLVTLANTEVKSLKYNGKTDDKGYLRLEGIKPGKYFIAVRNKDGDYYFQDGCLVVKAVEDSKVYLHLKRELDMANIVRELEEMRIMSLAPNPVGKIIEISQSPFVSLKNKKVLKNIRKKK